MRINNILQKMFQPRKLAAKYGRLESRMPTMSDSLKTLIRSGVQVDAILDVGILTGTQPLMEVFPDIKHHLFEPVDTHFNTITNNYRKIPHVIHQVALSDKDGTAYLACKSINDDGKISHSEVVLNEVDAKEIPGLISCKEIRLARLDTLIKDLDRDDTYLLKIDVDGHEMSVLNGSVETLKKASIVVIEAPINKVSMPHLFERSGFLMEHGFYLTDIVDMAYYDGVLWQVDLVFVRKNIVNTIDRLRPFEAEAFSFDRDKWNPLSDKL